MTQSVYLLPHHDSLPISGRFCPTAEAQFTEFLIHGMALRRFTTTLANVPNVAPDSDDPKGVPIDAIIFGGREIGRAQRLNSSHTVTSYAVFCLKKKKKTL